MGYKGGKKQEPTPEELEFIYSRIPLLSDSEILEEMQDEATFPIRTPGSIKRRRKEFNAAKKVLEVAVKKEIDSATARVKVKHWIDLAETAKKLRRNIYSVQTIEGELIGSIISGSISKASATDIFGYKGKTELVRIDKTDAENLLIHLKAEYEQFSVIYDWERLSRKDITDRVTNEMLKKLDIVSHRRWFIGTCRVCEPWHGTVTKTFPQKVVSMKCSTTTHR